MVTTAEVLAAEEVSWPEAFIFVGMLVAGVLLLSGLVAAYLQLRKQRVATAQTEELRQLVRRYEQLAEGSLDAQQRIAADLAELRARTAGVEQILRSVE